MNLFIEARIKLGLKLWTTLSRRRQITIITQSIRELVAVLVFPASRTALHRVCVPAGLHKPFPSNCLQLMVQAGAKGSTVCKHCVFFVCLC